MKRIVCLFAAAALALLPLSAAGPGDSAGKLPKEIRISYAKSPFNLPLIVAARRGMLEKAFAEKGVAVKFFEIDSGAKQAEAMASALLAASSVISVKAAGATVLATAEGFVKPQLVVAARSAFIRDYPGLVDLYVSVHKEAIAWIAAHEDEALAIGAKEQGISVEDARELAAASHFTADIGPAEVEALKDDVRFMLGSGMLTSPVEPAGLLRPGLLR